MSTFALLARRRSRSALRVASAIATLALLAVASGAIPACQVALHADSQGAQCDLAEGAPCNGDPAGLTCQGGICTQCVPTAEVCDGRDNNCDGVIDEGFDKDHDGYYECGAAGEIDCNDNDPTIHPGVEEICNGIDDNCNDKIDESPNKCTDQGEVCWTPGPLCLPSSDCRLAGCTAPAICDPNTGACTNADCVTAGCPTGQTCDLTTHVCDQQATMGEACGGAIVCQQGAGSCVALSLVGITSTAHASTVCAASCCQTPDCPTGFVCDTWTTGTSICVQASVLNLTPGTGAAASSCGSGSDCLSGVCTDGACADGCCASSTCGSGGTCTLTTDGNTFTCQPSSHGRGFESSCNGSSDCASGACIETDAFESECTKRCCTSSDCGNDGTLRCDYIPISTGSSDVVAACVPIDFDATTGTKLGGDTCSTGSDCRSSVCSGGFCDDACCKDTDCASGATCKPRNESSGSPMRCVVSSS